MKEMVGGCCVCSDERGWTENPLVYCDGAHCNVAVHQACYGIESVPTGPWYCRKCESQERQARVKCELCPSKDGALKRTDTGGWAHVVCSLYIPEVRFGNVTTMEPIVLQLVPQERYHKTCYICEEAGKESKASFGACMQCNKSGCKQHFHVTCAQAAGLLCEEAGNFNDNVKYCGYCSYHYQKLKKDNSNIKSIPAFKPIPPENSTPESSPEKHRSPPAPSSRLATSSASTVEINKPLKKKVFKSQSNLNSGASSVNSPPNTNQIGTGIVAGAGTEAPEHNSKGYSRVINKPDVINGITDNAVINTFPKSERNHEFGVKSEKVEKKAKRRPSTNTVSSASESPKPSPSPNPISSVTNGISNGPKTSVIASPNPTPSFTAMYGQYMMANTLAATKSEKTESEKTVGNSSEGCTSTKRSKNANNGEGKKRAKKATTGGVAGTKSSKAPKETHVERKPKKKKEEPAKEASVITNGNTARSSLQNLMSMHEYNRASTIVTSSMSLMPNGFSSYSPSVESPSPAPSTSTSVAIAETHRATPQTLQTSGNNFVSPSFPSAKTPSSCIPKEQPDNSSPQTLEQFLERQWTQGAQFLMEQPQHFDVASLLSCLHQLRAENERLEERARELVTRRDNLLAINARLMHPLNGTLNNHTSVISQAPSSLPNFLPHVPNTSNLIPNNNGTIPSSLPSSSTSTAYDTKTAQSGRSHFQDGHASSQMFQNVSPSFRTSLTSPTVLPTSITTGTHTVSNFIASQPSQNNSQPGSQQPPAWYRASEKR